MLGEALFHPLLFQEVLLESIVRAVGAVQVCQAVVDAVVVGDTVAL